jgi:hypothetical protein
MDLPMLALIVLFPLTLLLVPYSLCAAESEQSERHLHNLPSHQASGTENSLHESRDEEEDETSHEHHGQEAVTSMAEAHAPHMGPHFRWTTLQSGNQSDQRKAAEIVAKLQYALEPYRDYRKAIKDGYEPFLTNVKQPHYHFTSKWRGFKSAFRFNPEQPTSLLYKKTADGYELEGAMYTAPKRADEADLNKRIPLSVAQWHAHVNICLPPRREMKTADWKRFGPNGSIVTEEECDGVKGRWVPQLFGWMIHVYPFKDSVERIWTH